MPDINISTQDGLIQSTIKQRQETYYLVTNDVLNSLKGKSLLCDLFLFLASLGWGAYFSTTITISSMAQPTSANDAITKTLSSLSTLNSVFFWGAILFSFLTIIMYWQSYNGLKQITGGKVILGDNK